MSKPKNGDTVKVHYKGTLEDGSVFDTSEGRDPLEFTVGQGQLIPGFENAVLELTQGNSKTVTIPSGEAYGEKRDDLIISVPKKDLPDDVDPQVGMQLQVNQPDGKAIPVKITKVEEEAIEIDANHPLAGEDLTFEIELVEIGG